MRMFFHMRAVLCNAHLGCICWYDKTRRDIECEQFYFLVSVFPSWLHYDLGNDNFIINNNNIGNWWSLRLSSNKFVKAYANMRNEGHSVARTATLFCLLCSAVCEQSPLMSDITKKYVSSTIFLNQYLYFACFVKHSYTLRAWIRRSQARVLVLIERLYTWPALYCALFGFVGCY